MKTHLYIVFFILTLLSLMGFVITDNVTMGAVIGAIAGLIGSCISYYLFKNEKHRRTATTIIFLAIFFGTKNFIMPYYDAATLDASLKEKYPIYSIISTYYPTEYNEFIAQMKKNILNHDSLDNEINYSAVLINYATQKSIPFASPKTIYNYLQVNYQNEKKLYDINPMLVLALEFPGRVSGQYSLASTAQSIPDDELNKIIQAKAQLIESGSKDRTPIKFTDPEIAQATQTIQQIMTSLTEKYGKNVVDDTFSSSAPFKYPDKSAKLMLSFYELILAQGEQNGGLLFKMLYMVGTENEKDKSN